MPGIYPIIARSGEVCYSHTYCTSFEVNRKTKSACVSKTSMPSFSGRPRQANVKKSKPVVARSDARKRAAVKTRKNPRVGKVISGAPFPISYLDIQNNKKVNSLRTCMRLLSKNKILRSVATQTVDLPMTEYIHTGSTPNRLKGTSLLELGCNDGVSSVVSSWKRGSGDCFGRPGEMSKFDVCCSPLININPYLSSKKLESANELDGECNIGEAKPYGAKGGQLDNEKESLIDYINQAQDKVNNIRTRLVELNHTLKSQTATPISPSDSKHVRKLKKALDGITKEVDAVSEMGRNWNTLADASPISVSHKGGNNPKKMCGESYDYRFGATAEKQDHTGIQFQSKNHSSRPKKPSKTPTIHKTYNKQRRKVHSQRSSSWESLPSSVGKESSLTLLKNELGNFFEKMKMETDLLMEDAQMHHKALLHYSGGNSVSSSDIMSSDSPGL